MHSRFSQQIKSLLQGLAEQSLTIGDILAETSERGFSLVISLLVLPFLLPMPPGFTGPFGGTCLLLSAQMVLGRRTPWLPRKIANYQFPHAIAQIILQNLHRVTRVLEKITRPRLMQIASHPWIWRLNGLCIFWLTILLILPIPFTNPIPTVGILLLAVAMIESDGLLICISYVITALITLLFGFVGYALWFATLKN
ncbi:exopolysaccharide biosynthesis protein [Anabaena cylindrica FACHB-243]|uniref:Exopolysaccharide synthesis ExoD n=1 Tax=Anabaena cylindrica (strain ATCC 27899 / PCC 7122) TaxID=272123 RepID=K9ZAA8_ANACC|nr:MULTISPECIES: exopolysaccharide biosynthesis protein [Anabaena]AFZ55659.1 Exopolysaccharide synthesis ExoD [Anabaena cylindrica PCC 7122]MBD2420404.1 exopolysaccharide biosynthesis protein [Anabaena cylindrica FACHB-243]MBY5281751.1 exopolysaccharide biosynthesis protein [Anabaena sp. CCAP 1446/1C]MBY5310089.1 exopolysaccharide biosynthesis protein [Anabaena sp. CCAP 1446/1C]MCM2406970.1 exopolysaccharide biosynthesis protein [Anabaena sp. CCAP 1446/1C]